MDNDVMSKIRPNPHLSARSKPLRGWGETGLPAHTIWFTSSVTVNTIAIGVAIMFRLMSDVTMYDFNLPVFQRLSPAEQQGICRTAAAILNTAFVPLFFALLWSTVSGFILWRSVIEEKRRHGCVAKVGEEGAT
jgi:hypothetical protein